MGSVIFDFIYENYGAENIITIFYVVNLILAAIAYKLGFARELPIWKNVLVYIMLAIGNIIITLFSLVKFPITAVLIIITAVLSIYRFRLNRERKIAKTKNKKSSLTPMIGSIICILCATGRAN